MTFDQIPQGAVIASSQTERGSQHVELHGLELVCYAVIDGVKKEETKRTAITEEMKSAVAAQYAKRIGGNIKMGN
jgi:hypothetical protein